MKKHTLLLILLVATIINISAAQSVTYLYRDTSPLKLQCKPNIKFDRALEPKEGKTIHNMPDLKIKLFPNPATTIININSTLQSGEATLYWLTGKLAKRISFTNGQAQIPVTDLPKGIYLINVLADQKTITKKVVIK